jgi:hypothetical protein
MGEKKRNLHLNNWIYFFLRSLDSVGKINMSIFGEEIMKLTKFNFFLLTKGYSIQSWIHSTKTAFFKSGSDGIFFFREICVLFNLKKKLSDKWIWTSPRSSIVINESGKNQNSLFLTVLLTI